MATAPSTPEQREARESREQDRSGKSGIVIVDIAEPQSNLLVKRLRKGRGKLVAKVERIVGDLFQAGTVKSTAQPVVIVVRELPPSPFSFMSQDEDDDDDDD
jgi:DNA-binding TFAR19-related protein (PDSD5 family)